MIVAGHRQTPQDLRRGGLVVRLVARRRSMCLSWTTTIVCGGGLGSSGGVGSNAGVDLSSESGNGKAGSIVNARWRVSMLAADADHELLHFCPATRGASVGLAMLARARRSGFSRGLQSH